MNNKVQENEKLITLDQRLDEVTQILKKHSEDTARVVQRLGGERLPVLDLDKDSPGPIIDNFTASIESKIRQLEQVCMEFSDTLRAFKKLI